MKYRITYRDEITTDIEADNVDEAIDEAINKGTWEFLSSEAHRDMFEVEEDN